MKDLPNGWHIYQRRNADKEARKLKRRFSRVSIRYFRQQTVRRSYPTAALAVLAAVAAFAVGSWVFNNKTLPSIATLSLVRYVPNCATARALGVAPMYRDHPAYRAGLDADGDGIACEPYRVR